MPLQRSGAVIGLSKEIFLSIFFYAKQFRVQQLGYEKLGMNKTSLWEINSLSLPLLLSLYLKLWKSRKLLVIVDNSGQFILVILQNLEKLKLTVVPLILAVGKS